MDSFTLAQVNQFVLARQHLTGNYQSADIVQIADDIVGLHATGAREPYLALFARQSGFRREELDEALHATRRLMKIRCLRGTLYILSRETVPLVYAAIREMVVNLSRRYMEFSGVTLAEYTALTRQALALMAGREMTVAQVKAALGTRVNLAAVLNLMCDEGRLARLSAGVWTTRQYRYTLFREYYPGVDLGRYTEAEALPLLIERYLAAFGPATGDDIAWWLGITKTKVRAALKEIGVKLVPVGISGLGGEFLLRRADVARLQETAVPGRAVVNLLPNLDPYLMGYRNRERYLDPLHYEKVFDRGGNATSTVLVNSRVAGVWDFNNGDPPQVKILLFEPVPEDIRAEVREKAGEMGEFLAGRGVAVSSVAAMAPLTKRPPGAFMSPLRGG